MKKKQWILLIALVALTAAICTAQTENKTEPLSIEQQMEKVLFEWNRLDRPGVAVTVVKDGKVIFQKAYGLTSMEHNIHNTNKTLFDTVSIAKPFTGMAIAMLEAQGKISPGDDIRKYIPELPDFGKIVTVGHLLYHTSGIWDWSKALPAAGWRLEDVITFDHIMGIVKRQQKLQFDPGSKYLFSNTNYNLLAEIVKRVTGQSFRDWAWENIFRPVGMFKTVVRDQPGEPIENQAYGYDYQPLTGYRKGGDNLNAVGSHCVFSSGEDMGKWLLNLETGKVGGSTVMEKMFTPGVLDNGEKIDYAYGWEIDTYKGLKRFSVSGELGGFNSTLQYFPQHKFGVVMLSNWISGWGNLAYPARQIVDIYLEAYLEKPAPPPDSNSKTTEIKPNPDLYDQYAGDYRWEPGFVVNIYREKDKLMLKARSSSYELLPLSETQFKLSAADYRFTFQKDKDGKFHQVLLQEGEGSGSEEIAPKIELVNPTPDELQEFTGTYYCQELDARYTVILQDKKLVITHNRLSDVTLTPEARDHFNTDSRSYRLVEFIRDRQQKVSGLKMMGLDILFKKI
jgi:CubicO group peptidase (beta-lactamase class C family)